ncbi:MAG: magnesium/cobalt transporter CorA [Candidatus Omnitrophica bacterium]|nr:magnesium/cobalt transporter CorA [Candidatus Omnitrophota bacterium]
MARFIKKISNTIGLEPGALVYVGEKKTEHVRISIIDYDQDKFTQKYIDNIEDCFLLRDTKTVSWINIDGIHDTALIEKIGNHFNIHHLFMADIVNTSQRPKFEDAENYMFLILKMLYFDEKENDIKCEQVSLIVGQNFVISFQETEGDVFDILRNRIKMAKGKIRKMGADYLVYSIIDALVDNYFVILEKVGENIESMEDDLINEPTPKSVQTIQDLKRDIIFLRKTIWPLREVINGLEKTESKLIKKTTAVYLRDIYNHTIQIIDTIESFRDTVSGTLDIYLSSVSNRMNEVMKVLTIIATIFIPLTFVAGIYGMNFNTAISPLNMPELNWRYGYVFAWIIMISIVVGMVTYFKRKKWF